MKWRVFFTLCICLYFDTCLTTHVLAKPKLLHYKITNQYSFFNDTFTQGLYLDNDVLYISSGLYNKSFIQSAEFPSMKPIQKNHISTKLFAEGLTIIGQKLYLCTWKSKTCYIYDKDSFRLLDYFSIQSEGWGLTHNNDFLILSDGSDQLYFFDPKRYLLSKTLKVTYNNAPIKFINELEYVDGYIYANIWGSGKIILIHSDTGKVDYEIDLTDLITQEKANLSKGHVLNGIAFDSVNKRFLITGKFWDTLYELELDHRPSILMDYKKSL